MLSCIHMILWHIDPLPGRDLKANIGKAAVAVQRHSKHISTTIELLLGKHVPQQRLHMQRGKQGVVCAIRAKEL
jgi:hypothetical protein